MPIQNFNPTKKFHHTKSFYFFLAGFIEGEGSLTISIKKKPHTRFGYTLDPEFFLYQHYSGIHLLNNAKFVFGSGRVYKKSGSDNVYVFAISNRITIFELVIPFFRKYVIPFSEKYSWFDTYVYIVESLLRKDHLEVHSFINLIKLTYSLNPYSKGKERKIPLDILCNEILRDSTPNNTNL